MSFILLFYLLVVLSICFFSPSATLLVYALSFFSYVWFFLLRCCFVYNGKVLMLSLCLYLFFLFFIYLNLFQSIYNSISFFFLKFLFKLIVFFLYHLLHLFLIFFIFYLVIFLIYFIALCKLVIVAEIQRYYIVINQPYHYSLDKRFLFSS